MVKSKGPKWYAVKSGRKPGVYTTWTECEVQTNGYSGAIFKSFPSKIEAEQFVGDLVHKSKMQQPDLSIGSSKRGNSEIDDVGISGFNKRMRNQDDVLTLTINFDGASRGNPGIAGAGAFLQVLRCGQGRQKDFKIRKYLGLNETNNVAEYHGLLEGLKQAFCIIQGLISEKSSMISSINIIIQGDSNLIINQMKKIYQCKHIRLTPLYDECHHISTDIRDLCQHHGLKVEMQYEHIFRDKNTQADALANEAIDKRKSWIDIVDNLHGYAETSVAESDSNGGNHTRIQECIEDNKVEFAFEDV